MKPGDVAIIFTPDDSHFSLAAACINAGLHVLVAKPIVKTLSEHKQLVDLARKQNVLVGVPGGYSLNISSRLHSVFNPVLKVGLTDACGIKSAHSQRPKHPSGLPHPKTQNPINLAFVHPPHT
jgi:hypothetical protein